MSIVTYENVDTPVFEIDFLRYLFANGEAGLWLTYQPDRLYADVDKTVPAVLGGGIASFDDLSGNGVTGPQPTSTARPIMGRVPRTGRRNLLTWTEDLNNPVWIKSPALGEEGVVGGYPDSKGGSSGFLIIPPEGEAAIPRFWYNRQWETGEKKIHTISSKAAGYNFIALSTRVADGVVVYVIDLTTGVVAQSGGPQVGQMVTVADEGDGWWRITLEKTPLGAVNYGFLSFMPLPNDWQSINSPFRANNSYDPDGVSGILVCFPQVDAGENPTPYQRVTTQYDITEAGVRSVYYARYDSADDVLPRDATLPAITDGTVILIGQQGIWIDEGYAFAGGNCSLGPTTYPNGPAGIIGVVGDMLDLVVLDRPLTADERDRVVAYGIGRGSAGLLELMP